MNIKKLLICSILWSAFFSAAAQTTEYSNGVFILNEDWFGHNNSTINFLNPREGEFDYLILQGNTDNEGLSLGCTAQYGTVYGDNLYIMSKQDQDSGETQAIRGGRIIVADAKTLKVKKRIPVIFEISGKSAADGRCFVGVNENKGYVGTSNGIFILNLNNFEIGSRIAGTENPLITGNESNANGEGPLYRNQIGMMCRTSDYVFAIQQDKGVLVIDPEKDSVVKVIRGCFSTLTQSKDGTVWVGKNTNVSYQEYPYGTVGEHWDGNQLLKINPYTLATETVNMSGGAGINQTWYAWTAGSLCASTKENVLYFAYNESDWNWFTTSKMYRYDIDSNEFSLIYNSEDEERYFYGASLRINPLDDKIYAALYLDNINQTYFIYQLDNTGNLLKVFEPIKRYWFPAMFIFPDKRTPAVSEFSQITLENTQSVTVDLRNMASDRDNLSAAITKRIMANDNENILSAVVKNDKLTLTAKEEKSGTARVTVRFNSNGKIVDRVQEVVVSTMSESDNAAPAAPENFAAVPAETSIALLWTASTDNVGVAGYNVYLDGESIKTVTEANFTVSGLSSSTEYTLEVEAFDAAGNKSAKAKLTVSTTDETVPSIPTDFTAVPVETSIALSWTASTDNVGVAGYVVYLDGNSIKTVTETSFVISGLSSETEYTLEVEAFDAAGNKSAKAKLTVSTTAPAADEVAPSAPGDLAAEPAETSIALSWTASTDNVGVAGYNVYQNGESIETVTETNFTVSGLSSSTEYTFEVEAFDAAGNKSVKAKLTVSTTAPAADEVAPSAPENLVAEPAETSIALSWTASTDNVGVAGYVVYLDGNSIKTVTETSFVISGLSPETEYTLEVEAFDAAGNKSAKSAIIVLTVDKTAPTIPADLTVVPAETSIALSWTASMDNVGVTGYNVYVGDGLYGTTSETSYTLTGLDAATEYQIGVEAVDAAGNKSGKATVTQSTLITGMEALSENELKVYPNPFTSFIVIEATMNEEATICNIYGQVVLQISLNAGVNQIDVSGLKEGIYLLKCGSNSFKIIKQINN
uniref:DUF5074 domain-containing protein n=1 Tax=uncultured Draconibacterium sp. TaxID=1573823 RepID=UPI003216B04A